MFADDWIQTMDLWHWKQPLYQLSHNLFDEWFVFFKVVNPSSFR